MRKPRVSRLSRPAPAPLLEWDPPLARQLRARRRPVLAASMIGLALLGLGAVLDFAIRPAPRLVWNASASAPVGLWRIDPHARLHTGDMVLARSPRSVRTMAAKRRYLPANVPLLKRIATHGAVRSHGGTAASASVAAGFCCSWMRRIPSMGAILGRSMRMR